MKLNSMMTLTTVVGVISCSCMVTAQSTEDIESAFPLTKGTYWIYEGIARGTETDLADADGKPLTWALVEKKVTFEEEVVEVINRKHVTGFLIRVSDVDGQNSNDYIILRVGPGKFYKLLHNDVERALKRLRDEKDSLGYLLIAHAEPFLDLPLKEGKVFGISERITRQDRQYCWVVEGEEAIQFKDIKGVSPSRKMTQYRLGYRIMPSHTIVDFVPGIGITRYTYEHHGTPMDIEYRLVEFHAGN